METLERGSILRFDFSLLCSNEDKNLKLFILRHVQVQGVYLDRNAHLNVRSVKLPF
jgi:hypothetical protein